MKTVYKYIPWFFCITASLVATTILICVFYVGFDLQGWVLTTVSDNSFKDLSTKDKALIYDLTTRGKVFSASDLLGNFTSYYHFLISMLISFLVLFTGFVGFKFYESKTDHDELLVHRLNKFFKSMEKGIHTNGLNKELDDYEDLKEYLQERIFGIIQSSELDSYADDIVNQYREYLDEKMGELVEEQYKEEIYQYCLEKIQVAPKEKPKTTKSKEK